MATDAENPLRSDSAAAWNRLIEAVGPASLLAIIELRMGAVLRRRISPEDVFQEALLHAWRDRAGHEWRGVKSFRNWLLTIIDHRIHDLAEKAQTQKRGGNHHTVAISALIGSEGTSAAPLPWDSTTPSRIAIYREQAEAMRAALASLPDDVRDVVRLRVFEQLNAEEIGGRLSLGVAAVRYRTRKGAELYQRRLVGELATRSLSISQLVKHGLTADSSPEE